jgi:hypothetical protein
MLSGVKTLERHQARWYRRYEGRSVKDIARVVGVSPSTVSLWVRDIELTEGQHEALLARNPAYDHQRNGWAENVRRGRARRGGYQLTGRQLVRLADPLYVAGCMLYWAEGDKTRNSVRLTNSDPALIALFGRFLRECFGVPEENFRVNCYLFADHVGRQREVEQFWLDVLGLPGACLRKSIVNSYSRASKRKRVNKLPYGTCKVVVHRTEIVQTIYGSIQEFAGFERPEWLDG